MLIGLCRRLDGFLGRLGSRRRVIQALAIATLLATPSLGSHRALDDWVLSLSARGLGHAVGLRSGTLDLFAFTTGDPVDNHRLMDVGVMLPWWTDDRLHIAFYRPVSSFTHWADERLWPGNAFLMHAQSLIWFAAMLGAAALAYRRLEGATGLFGLAFLLFAVDDAHGSVVAWLSNRNALIAATFGFLALAAHDVWRRSGSRWALAGALGAFVAGLGAGELAVGTLAYVISYAVFIDRGRPVIRTLAVLPYLAIVLGWRVGWAHGGYGAHGSGVYIDPLADPTSFLATAPAKLAMLFQGQFSVVPADLSFFAPPAEQPLLLTVATSTVVVVTWLLWPFVRDPLSRFWAAGCLMSLLPLAATFASDRLLLFVGLGAMALIARLVRTFVADGARGKLRFGPRAILSGAFVLLHLGAAPILLPLRSAQLAVFSAAHDRGARGIPSDATVVGKNVVLLAAPTLLFGNYIQAQREALGVPRPRHLYVLADASSPIEVTRASPTEIDLRPAEGFLYTPLDRHYRGSLGGLNEDKQVVLSAISARIMARRDDGRPAAVRFSFPEAPERYLFFRWSHDRYVPCELPQPGEKWVLPEEDMGRILLDTIMNPAGSYSGAHLN